MKRNIIMLSLIIILLTALPCQANLTKNLVAYFPLNGNSKDFSGNENHAALVGKGFWIKGMRGKGLRLGGQAYLVVQGSPSLDLTRGSGTICAFIKIDPASDDFGIVAKESSSSFPHTVAYEFAVRGGGKYETAIITNGTECSDLNNSQGQSLKDSRWHHLAFTWSGPVGKIRLYRDGVKILEKNQTISTINNLSDSVLIGAFRWNVSGIFRCLTGEMDEVRIYSRALRANEIRQLASGIPPVLKSDDDSDSDDPHFITP